MNDNPDSDLAARLAALLAQCESAHGEHETRTGERDEQWADWYADYLRQHGIAALLDGLPGRSSVLNNLSRLLAEADKNHRSSGTSEPWPPYYARYFLSLASQASAKENQGP